MKITITQKLFELVGENQDSLTYLNSFRAIPKEKFALIYIEPVAFSEYGESFLFDLKLLQGLELYPLVLLEATVFEYAKHFFKGSLCLGEEADPNRLYAEPIYFNLPLKEKIQTCIQKQKIPFILYEEKISFLELKPLLCELTLGKILYLSSERFFFDKKTQAPISIVNLENEYPKYYNSNEISELEKNLLKEFYELLKSCAFLRSISITSPATLLKELFTVKGSGTYFKLGSKIFIYNSIQNLDVMRLRFLLEDAFQKKIRDSFFTNKFDSIFLESNYKGAAIVIQTQHGNFLSKFAVNAIARGEGIGREIWDAMLSKYNKIFWRAKVQNPINKWYMKICTGVYKFPTWNIYWIGYKPEEIPSIAHYLLNLPEDFQT